jgi:hypothetical protein
MKTLLKILAAGLLLLLLTACVQRLSHFKCYIAAGEPIELEERLRLEDQFHIEEDVEVVGVKYFCNPVTKFQGIKSRQAERDEDHLTCYLIRDEQRFWAEIDIRNQFGEAQLDIRDDELLCVPTYKSEDFKSIPPPPGDNCPGGEYCCCEKQHGFTWPSCNSGFTCKSSINTAGPDDYIQVCMDNNKSILTPIQLHWSQPPFCTP